MGEPIGLISAFWGVFSFSFLTALTGAMAPGPLLTYTIIKSARSHKHGYLMGVWIITGHALLEMGIIFFLLLGFSFVLKNIIMVRAIGILGGVILFYFGASIIRDIRLGNISTEFLDASHDGKDLHGTGKMKNRLDNPVVGGIMVSMANPYWWVWWATIGFAFMVQFNVSLQNGSGLIAFFLGHEAGDLLWYVIVSTLSFFGIRHLNKKAYHAILGCCGLFMIVFGIYLGVSPFFRTGV